MLEKIVQLSCILDHALYFGTHLETIQLNLVIMKPNRKPFIDIKLTTSAFQLQTGDFTKITSLVFDFPNKDLFENGGDDYLQSCCYGISLFTNIKSNLWSKSQQKQQNILNVLLEFHSKVSLSYPEAFE